MHRLLLILPLFLLPARAATLAELEPPAKAALLGALRAGNAAYDAGDYAAALAAYDRGLDLASLPDLHYRRAQCLERLDRPGDAAAAFRAYLAAAPTARDRARVERDVARLEAQAMARTRSPLTVTSTPTGAHVRVGGPDGARLGETPLTTAVEAGRAHVLWLGAPGHAPVTRRVLAPRGEAVTVEVALAPVTPPADLATPGWVALGGGAALAVGAGVLAGVTEARVEAANDYDRRAEGHSRAALNDLQADARAAQAGFWVTAGLAGAALVTGATLLWLDAGDAPVQASVGPGGAALVWRFGP